jgi:hypothetical protein
MKTYPFDADVVAEAVEQPPLAELARRATRRTRRRRVAWSALAAVVVGAGALVATTPRQHAEPPGAGSRTYFTDTVAVDEQTVISVRWSQCAVVVSVTTDAGATWTPYRGPVEWVDCGLPIRSFYEVYGPRTFAAEIEGERYVSRDAGATWQRESERTSLVDNLPPGAQPRPRGFGWQYVDPDTGEMYQLSSIEPQSVWGSRPAPDGSLWMIGSNAPINSRSEEVPTVTRSVDRGRTWQPTGALPAVAVDVILVPASAREAYLLAREGGKSMVYRTADGGTTWTGAPAPWASARVATIDPGGALIVFGDNAAWSTVDGRSFTGPTPVAVANPRPGARQGLIWVTGDDGSTRLTVDGRTWHRIAPRP